MGVDYNKVRTVLHACIPESIDRFYQEVGRGGRDRKTSISLLIPCKKDWTVANYLGSSHLLTIDKAWERWNRLFRNKIRCLSNC